MDALLDRLDVGANGIQDQHDVSVDREYRTIVFDLRVKRAPHA
jgi:hypothetical protein